MTEVRFERPADGARRPFGVAATHSDWSPTGKIETGQREVGPDGAHVEATTRGFIRRPSR
jgi:hypothetical protein